MFINCYFYFKLFIIILFILILFWFLSLLFGIGFSIKLILLEFFRLQSSLYIGLSNVRDKEEDDLEEDEDLKKWHEERFNYDGK